MSAISPTAVESKVPLTIDRVALESYVYREARLQDEHQYDEWESLWADDGIYWVPANDYDSDPKTQVSYIYDNRARLAGRIRQLKSGRRHAQIPGSRMRRVVSNLEYAVVQGLIQVHANFNLTEIRNGRRNLWCGRTRYDLRPIEGDYELVLKKVMLVDNNIAIPNLGFLI